MPSTVVSPERPGDIASTGTVRSVTKPRGIGAIFEPQSIAVVGASERPGSLGASVFRNILQSGFAGSIDAVNRRCGRVLGRQAVGSLRDLAAPPDLVVIAIPARGVESIVDDCIACGVSAAVIISAGFECLGAEAASVQDRIHNKVQQAGLRIIGPNCLGILRPSSKLNASFASSMANPGRLAFLSQSGALCTAVLDWSLKHNVGFSAMVSVGSMLDVDWGDLIDYFGNDPETSCILAYVESVGDARSFLAAARNVALSKPILALKGGRTSAAAKAAASHTGALAGSDRVFEAAMRRVGVLQVDQLSDLFYAAEALANQPRPQGRNLTILTNAGGPGIIATDALVRGGGRLATLNDDVVARLSKVLPEYWSRQNPIDIIGDADPDRFAAATQIALENPESDGLLLVLTPQSMTDPRQTAERLVPLVRTSRRPVFASWMGGPSVDEANAFLATSGIPTFTYPDTAARTFNALCQYNDDIRDLYETPSSRTNLWDSTARRTQVSVILEKVIAGGRTTLTEQESKQVLSAYGIPTTPTVMAASEDDAIALAEELGFPVAVKLHSLTQTHKSDVNGVCLNLRTGEEVRVAFEHIRNAMSIRGRGDEFLGVTVQRMERRPGVELILGSSYDEQFGPCVLFGAGGTLVEILRDQSLAIPPVELHARRKADWRYEDFQGSRWLPKPSGDRPAGAGAHRSGVQRSRHGATANPRV